MKTAIHAGARRPIIAALALAGVIPASFSHAAIITVSNLSDTSGTCRLRDAIASMNIGSDSGGCTADIAPEGYGTNDTIEITGNGTLVLDASNGELLVNDNASSLRLQGQPGSSITLSGGATINYNGSNIAAVDDTTCSGGTRILRIDGRATRIDNLTFTAGYAQDPSQSSNLDRQGGAIGFFPGGVGGGDLTIVNSSFIQNCADLDGGAVFVGVGDASVVNALFQNNLTLGGRRGAGIHVEPEDGDDASLSARTSIFRGNFATGGGGGIGIRNADATIEDSEISGNFGDYGGGIYLEGARDGVYYDWEISNSTISNNSASFASNYWGSGYYGGGLALTGWYSANIRNTTITQNAAPYAGGIYVRGFFGNIGDPPTLALRSTILAANTATDPGLTDYRDIAVDSSQDYTNPSLQILSSLLGVAYAGLTYAGDGNTESGTPATPLNPRLGPLADNGGLSRTHALLFGSPALDSGYNPDPALGSDQRGSGFSRTMGAGTDMGAYEAQEPPTQLPVSATPVPLLGPLGLILLSLFTAVSGWLGLARRR